MSQHVWDRLNTIFWSSEVCQQRLQILRKNVFCSIKLLFKPFFMNCKIENFLCIFERIPNLFGHPVQSKTSFKKASMGIPAFFSLTSGKTSGQRLGIWCNMFVGNSEFRTTQMGHHHVDGPSGRSGNGLDKQSRPRSAGLCWGQSLFRNANS